MKSININQLKKRVYQSIDEIKKEYNTPLGADYIYINRDSKILLVAHMDYHDNPVFLAYDNKANYIFSPQLDDRLGVYLILDYLIDTLDYDILLTDYEESCLSSAWEFIPRQGVKYNWGVELDRAGIDVVQYQYTDNSNFTDAIKRAGFNIGVGSYSDIKELSELKCQFFNLGIGYKDQHRLTCYASLTDIYLQVNRLMAFYHHNKNTHFKHKPRKFKDEGITVRGITYYDDGIDYSSRRDYASQPLTRRGNKYFLKSSIPVKQYCESCGIELNEAEIKLCIDCKDFIDRYTIADA